MRLYVGLRRGEPQALNWAAVDFEAGLIGVERSWDRVPGSDRAEELLGPARVPLGEALRTVLLDLAGWPDGSRVIVRRERPHPGAQLSFSDHDGHRFQAILTDQTDTDIAAIERGHRRRARVEDHIRNDKDTGLSNLPFRDFEHNRVWLALVLIAHDLICWTQTLLLDGEPARAEPKRLRYRLLHVAARLAFHARGAKLRLQARWPWAADLAAAFARLRALPAPAG